LIDFPLQTAVAALHLFLGMGTPGSGDKAERVLIWGAGGAVGAYAVQYAKSVSRPEHGNLEASLTFSRLGMTL